MVDINTEHDGALSALLAPAAEAIPACVRAPRGDTAKRCFDFASAAVALFVLGPLLLAIALCLKAQGGTALFGHWRIGRGGKTFRCLKFRTMVPDADRVLDRLFTADPRVLEEWNRDFKLRNDPRVTRLGRVLRKTSLDELPQLINVMRGEMSLVGPRPIVVDEMPRYGTDIQHYLSCWPGITGLWQVNGRNDVDYTERVALDSKYALERSFRMDVLIILKTLRVVAGRRGAY